MSEHFFVSYAHQDKAYAQELTADLKDHGFEDWIDDDRLNYGAAWKRKIEQAIRTCWALFVVMTPDSAASQWVQREISLALEEDKPIFPLLRRGDHFFMLNHLLYVDVSDGRLPSPTDYAKWQRSLSPVRLPEVNTEARMRTALGEGRLSRCLAEQRMAAAAPSPMGAHMARVRGYATGLS